MGLSKGLSCEAGSIFCCHNPKGVFQSEVLRLNFPELEPWVALSVSLLVYLHANVSPALPAALPATGSLAAALPEVLSILLPISAPLTGLDECFFFNSLVVRLPYSSIFCQSWLFFVFKFVVLFLLCKEAQCVYLCLHLGRKSLCSFFFHST